ncbi:MAG: hypothetical protein Q8M20_04595 [Rhodocyclaceae bacterium]|nr:hypothetical protein [Rhodocyclaceae bacterium]MDZ4214038.1 hypothetical protein [Rhodocyclaceae bacterium]
MIEIHLQADAPEKPAVGALCNGCGVCCSFTPCPLSRLLLQHRVGSCPALLWQAMEQRYGCGLVIRPEDYLAWLPQGLSGLARLFAKRWIAAGIGCDCDAEPEVSSAVSKEIER